MANSPKRNRSKSTSRSKNGSGNSKGSKSRSKSPKNGKSPKKGNSKTDIPTGIGSDPSVPIEGEEPFEVDLLPEPNTSPRDPNHYRIIHLDNQVKAILISTLGYAEDEALRVIKERNAKNGKCEEMTGKSVFERSRSRSRQASEENLSKKKGGVGVKQTTSKCYEKTVEKFDKDMAQDPTQVARDSTKSFLDELGMNMFGPSPDEEPMDVDEPVKPTVKKDPEEDGLDEDDDDGDVDVFNEKFKPDPDSSTEDSNINSQNQDKKTIPIKTKWGPEPETEDPELLEEERKIMQKKDPEVEFAMTVYGGSMHDDLAVQGLSYLARQAVARGVKERDVHSDSQGFNPAEYTTIRVTTSIEHLYQNLVDLGANSEKFKFDLRYVKKTIQDIDNLDRLEENIQCMRCWDSPMIDERRLAILASLAKDGHPIRAISTGHQPSLWAAEGASQEELYRRVSKFIETHYCGSSTTIAVKAPDLLDNIQKVVTDGFMVLAEGSKEKPAADKEPFNTRDFKMFYKVLCSNPHCSDLGDAFLVIAWGLPPEYWKNYLTKPLDYLSAMISDKGVGSLSHYLREKNLVWDLNAACETGTAGFHRNEFCSLFEIQATLNEDGLKNVDEVIKTVFSYLKFLKENGVSREFFKEQQKIRSAQFHALGQEVNFDDPYPLSISKLSLGLQMYETRDLFTGPILLRKYDAVAIQKCTELLVPETANYMLCVCAEDDTSKIEPGENVEVQVERIFNTKYFGTEISAERLKSWSDVSAYADFTFPEPNPYIHVNSCRVDPEQTDFNLFDAQESPLGEFYRIWYHQDIREDHFALYYINIISPVAFACPENAVMLQLWYLLLQDLLHPHLGKAAAAGINYNLKSCHHGLLISVFSWNSELPAVVEKILLEIADFEKNVSRESFKKKKKGWLKHLSGLIRDEFMSNHTIAMDLYDSLVNVNRWKLVDLYNELLPIQMKHFIEFINQFKRKFSVVALLRGNVNHASAADFANKLEATLPPNHHFYKFHIRQNQLPKREHIFRIKTLSSLTTENYVGNFYQIGRACLKTRVCADLFFLCLTDYLEEFKSSLSRKTKSTSKAGTKVKSKTDLREKEERDREWYQLVPKLLDHQGIITLIVESYGNSSHNGIRRLDERADEFLEQCFNTRIKKMDDQNFKALKKRLGAEKYNDPASEFWDGNEDFFYDLSGLYGVLEDLTYRFTDNYCKLEALKSVQIEDLQCFFKLHLAEVACELRKLSVQIRGNDPEKLGGRHQQPPETVEEWRERRKTLRECTFNERHSLIHAHKMGKGEQFHIRFEPEEEGICDNDHFVTNFTLFKRSLYQFPISICQD